MIDGEDLVGVETSVPKPPVDLGCPNAKAGAEVNAEGAKTPKPVGNPPVAVAAAA